MILPNNVIKLDDVTKSLTSPTLLLRTRSFQILGEINSYEEWSISINANAVSELNFTVYKNSNGIKHPNWDDLVDLKIIDVVGVGQFEISVDYTDDTKTTKTVRGESLEVELGQLPLYELHVNDEESMSMEMTEFNSDDFDASGNYIPTVFCNFDDEKHSLLHRVLADKAPHWSIGHVPTYIAINKDDKPELANKMWRTFSVDGTSIYDFLMGEVSEEFNVIFSYDTYKRIINVYNLEDCVWSDGKQSIIVTGIGQDTTIFVDNGKLSNEIVITSDKNSVKNCFRVEGGDDYITSQLQVVNMNGSQYIYKFAPFMLQDMPKGLSEAILKYQTDIEAQKEIYYGENGIYPRLSDLYNQYSYLTSEMMPSVEIKETTAKEQYDILIDELNHIEIGVSTLANYNNNLFVGITNNVVAMAQVLIDSRYVVEVIDDSSSYKSNEKVWSGKFKIYRKIDETEFYISPTAVQVNVNDDELTFTQQKIQKALAKTSMLDIDFEVSEMTDKEIRNYFNMYGLERLKSFHDGYESCLSIIITMSSSSAYEGEDSVLKELYKRYLNYSHIVSEILDNRQLQVDDVNVKITATQIEQNEFQEKWNFQNYLEKINPEYYKIFCMYRREDTYQNDNYLSDGLSDSECLKKAKELLTVAEKEISKACQIQRSIDVDLNNLLLLEEFKALHDKFALFNYIRIGTDDEILKLRLLNIDFSSSSPDKIQVKFADNIVSVGDSVTQAKSIFDQVSTISSSYSSVSKQAKSGEIADDKIANLYNNGLNAAKIMIFNNDKQEATMDNNGFGCKRMDDEGFYSGNQLKMLANGIYMTTNYWEDLETVFGETLFNEKKEYGLIAKNIVGKFIASERAEIGNTDGTVSITGSGIEMSNGVIKSSDYSVKDFTGSIINLSDGSFSFAGGSLTFDNKELKIKGNIEAIGGKFSGNIASTANITGGSISGAQIKGGDIVVGSEQYGYFHIGDYGFNIQSGIDDKYKSVTNLFGDRLEFISTVFSAEFGSNGIYINFEDDNYFRCHSTELSYSGFASVDKSLSVGEQLQVSGDVSFQNNLNVLNATVNNNLNVSNDLKTSGTGTFGMISANISKGNQIIAGTVNNNLSHSLLTNSLYCQDSAMLGSMICNGKATLGSLTCNNDATVKSLNCSDNATVGSLKCYNAATLGSLNMQGKIYLSNSNGVYATLGNGNRATAIGSLSGTEILYLGDNSFTTMLRGSTVYLKNTNTTVTSDLRLKENVDYSLDNYEDFFNRLKPISFTYKTFTGDDGQTYGSTSGRTHFSFGAQDVYQALIDSGLNTKDFAGYVDFSVNGGEDELALAPMEFIPLNTYMIKKCLKEIQILKQEISNLKGEL